MSGTGIRQRLTASSLLERRFEVTRAVIPCAGPGAPLPSVAKGAPNELLELGGLTAIEQVLRECASSLITTALVVIAPGKEAIAFKVLKLAGTPGFPQEIKLLEQPAALGLADAIGRARDTAPEQPLAVVLPSVLYKTERPALAQVIATYRVSLHAVMGMVEARAAIAATKQSVPVIGGVLTGEEVKIDAIPDVGTVGTLPPGSVPYTSGGRFVFSPDSYVALDAVLRAATPGTDADITPVLQRMLSRGQLTGKMIRGRYCDVSVPTGYEDAKAAFAKS
jgi:UTP--glucose-1-phosphate uridylyltransferase